MKGTLLILAVVLYAAEGANQRGFSVADVFLVNNGRYTYNYDAAKAACESFGGSLASEAQLDAALKAGMSSCSCGWTLEKKILYPIAKVSGSGDGCGGSQPGMRTCTWLSNANAYCYKQNYCKTNPCQSGQLCIDSKTSYVCTCPYRQIFNEVTKQCDVMVTENQNALGCYLDKAERDLDGEETTLKPNSPQRCIDYCKSKNYLYAGTQYSSQCFCGNSYGKWGKRPMKECNMPCDGNAASMCGASYRNNVYRTGYQPCSTNPCGSGRQCVNTDSGYWCSCTANLIFNESTRKCETYTTGTVNALYERAFNALRSGTYNNVKAFVTSIDPIYADVNRKCGNDPNSMSCKLLAVLTNMKLTSGLPLQYVNRNGRVVIEPNEYRNINLKTYLNELQDKTMASKLLYDVSKGLNVVLKQTTAEFRALGNYFNQVASYDTQIATKDTEFLRSTLDALTKKSKEVKDKISKDLNTILISAITAAGIEIVVRTANVAIETAVAVSGLVDILPDMPNPNDIADRVEQLTQAIADVKEAAILKISLEDLGKEGTKLGLKFADNKNQIKILDSVIASIRDNGNKVSQEIQNKFVTDYGNYNPKVTNYDVQKFTAQLNKVATAGCDLFLKQSSAIAKQAEMINKWGTDACRVIEADIAGLTALYEEIYQYQFDLVDAYAKIVRGNIAKTYSSQLGSSPTQIDLYGIIQGMILDQNKVQTVAMLYCNQLEYTSGGIRAPSCLKDYFSEDDINKIVSVESGLQTVGKTRYTYTYIPAKADATENGFIDIKGLLEKKPVRFSMPRSNTDWLVNQKWIQNNGALTDNVYYIKNLEPIVPGLTCATSTNFRVTFSEQSSLYNNPTSTTYMIGEKMYDFYYKLGTTCANNEVYSYASLKKSGTTSVCSNSDQKPSTTTLMPGLFSQYWTVQFGFSGCSTTEIDNAIKNTPEIPFRVTYDYLYLSSKTRANFLNWCWPNPCQNGGTCANDEDKLTYKCTCTGGATGKSCENLPDKCATMQCSGGTCKTTTSGAVCYCGEFQHYDGNQGKCVPDNCGSRSGMCGSATCVDYYNGPKCECPAGQIYWASIKACRLDYCRAGHCGSESCTNSEAKATCNCGASGAFDPKTKKCKNACPSGACPSGVACTTKLVGYYNTAQKVCNCGTNRLYWSSQNVCADDFCKRTNCGTANCVNSVSKATCTCPSGQKYVAKRYQCEVKKCDVGGSPPACGNYYEGCRNSGREVCASWKGGCWGSSRQFQCCNYC